MTLYGVTQSTVTESFDVPRSVVAMLWRCYQEIGELTRQNEQSPHHMTSQLEDQYLHWQYMARRLQFEFRHAVGQRIFNQTICNRLHEGGLSDRHPAKRVYSHQAISCMAI